MNHSKDNNENSFIFNKTQNAKSNEVIEGEQSNNAMDKKIKEEKIELVNNALEWAEMDEISLLNALKLHGNLDFKNLMKSIPSKRKESLHLQIKLSAIRSRAAFRNALKNVKKRSIQSYDGVPIQEWLKIFDDILPAKTNSLNVHRAFIQSLLYISEYEKIAPPEQCAGIDLKELYKYLYHGCLGLPYKDINSQSMDFLFYTLKKLNQNMLNFMPHFEKYLNEIDLFSNLVDTNQKFTINSLMKAIYEESILNPLGLPIQLFFAGENSKKS